jgi:bacterioferritin-associated ferredoxin
MALICHCEAVRERTIVKAIHRGAETLRDVQSACGAASRCGGCEESVLDLLDRHARLARPASHQKVASYAG